MTTDELATLEEMAHRMMQRSNEVSGVKIIGWSLDLRRFAQELLSFAANAKDLANRPRVLKVTCSNCHRDVPLREWDLHRVECSLKR